MHPNPAFRQVDQARNIAFARDRGFGTLCVNADPSPLLAHIPVLLSEDGTTAELHLVRSNPIVRMGETAAVIAVQGPDGYVSPDWYGVPDQVPTWNYVAVHLRGRLVPLAQDHLHPILDRLSAHFEGRHLPKPPWTMDKMDEDTLGRMLRQILPYRFEISEITGTWKLNQNKPDEVRLRAADQIGSSDLARLMRDLP